jgi:hypothetical protein
MADTILTTDRSGNLAANSLLSTKLFIPQARHLQDVLPRPRLVERLKTAIAPANPYSPLPAGFGKTIFDRVDTPQRTLRLLGLLMKPIMTLPAF